MTKQYQLKNMRPIKLRKPISANYYYDFNVGLDNHMTIRGIPDGEIGNRVDLEINIIVRWIYGVGASLDQIVSAVGLQVKLQYKKDENIKRAKLITKFWRYCRAKNIPITVKRFPTKEIPSYPDYKFSDIIKLAGI